MPVTLNAFSDPVTVDLSPVVAAIIARATALGLYGETPEATVSALILRGAMADHALLREKKALAA